MLLAAMSNAGRIYNTSLGPLLSNLFRPTAVFVTIGCWMVVLAFAGTVEVFLCVARVYLAKGAKYILVWVSHRCKIITAVQIVADRELKLTFIGHT